MGYAIDAKTSSNLYVYGTIHSNNGTYNGNPLWPSTPASRHRFSEMAIL